MALVSSALRIPSVLSLMSSITPGLIRARSEFGDQYTIELLSPYVLRTQQPDADDQSVLWWWELPHELRQRTEQLVVGENVYRVDTIDHGQRVGFAGDDPFRRRKTAFFASEPTPNSDLESFDFDQLVRIR